MPRSSKSSLYLRLSHQNPLSHTCYVPHPSLSSWHDHQNNIWIGADGKPLYYAICPLPCYFVSFRPKYLLSILFVNTRSLCSSLNVRDRLWHPYKRTGKMCSSVYFNLYIPGYQTERQKMLHQTITSIFWVQPALNFLMNVILIFQGSQIYEVFNTLKRYVTCLYVAFCQQEMNIHLVCSEFTSQPFSFLMTNRASVLFFKSM